VTLTDARKATTRLNPRVRVRGKRPSGR
jgi:hypothetical protein